MLIILTFSTSIAVSVQCTPEYDCSAAFGDCSGWPWGTTCQNTTCVPPQCAEPDILCPPNQYCDFGTSRCQPTPKAFEPCTGHCGDRAFCTEGRCIPECYSANATCPAGSLCTEGYCLQVVAGKCGRNSSHVGLCGAGLKCIGTKEEKDMIQGTCLPFRVRGCQCQSDDQCFSGACVMGACLDSSFKVGDSCVRDSQCLTGNCTNGKCIGFECSVCGTQDCDRENELCHPYCEKGKQWNGKRGSCITPQVVGGPCVDYEDCNFTLSCYDPMDAGSGTCQMYNRGFAPVGAVCRNQYDCQSSLCRQNICSTNFTNIPCNESVQCPNGYYCSHANSICVKYPDGKACTTNEDCGLSDGSTSQCVCLSIGKSLCSNRTFGWSPPSSGGSRSWTVPTQYAACQKFLDEGLQAIGRDCYEQTRDLFEDEMPSPSIFARINSTCARPVAFLSCCFDCALSDIWESYTESPFYPTYGLNCATLTWSPSAPGTFCDAPAEIQAINSSRVSRCSTFLQNGIPLFTGQSTQPAVTGTPKTSLATAVVPSLLAALFVFL